MVALNLNDATLWGRDPAARQALAVELFEKFGVIVTRKAVMAHLLSTGRDRNCVSWLFNNKLFRAGRGQYTLQPVLLEGANVGASTDAAVPPSSSAA